METWAEIRRRVLVDGLSKRAACREYDIHWDTLTKILDHPEPPGYRRSAPRPKPKLDPFLPVIHQLLSSGSADRVRSRCTRPKLPGGDCEVPDRFGAGGAEAAEGGGCKTEVSDREIAEHLGDRSRNDRESP